MIFRKFYLGSLFVAPVYAADAELNPSYVCEMQGGHERTLSPSEILAPIEKFQFAQESLGPEPEYEYVTCEPEPAETKAVQEVINGVLGLFDSNKNNSYDLDALGEEGQETLTRLTEAHRRAHFPDYDAAPKMPVVIIEPPKVDPAQARKKKSYFQVLSCFCCRRRNNN